jgi:ubiquinone/menaquinone biosynthesis C-methylase UbiE
MNLMRSTMDNKHGTRGLTESYARWRSSHLGQVTDALEQQLLFEMLGSVNGKALLDVGCGDGDLALELARRGAVVTGLDANPAMLTAARRRGDILGISPRFIEGDAGRLPFEDATFDLVVAVTLLCFVRDAEQAVTEMGRVLKPGGRLVIGELARWNLWAAHRRIRGWTGNQTWRAATFHTTRELRVLVNAAGLDVAEIRGAIHYPPCGLAAKLLAPVDLWLWHNSTVGAAFVVLLATKPLRL